MTDPKAESEAKKSSAKSAHAEREERILAFWKEKGIFEKTLNKESPKGEFVFYEGPPGANGRPHIGHFEARAFKDAIPRYRTMRGYHVRRKGGWDTHGLPVELQVEKELGLKSKKEIDAYGVAAFNDKCKESVWRYVHEWEAFTDRMAYWVDLKDPYITYKPDYIESVWDIIKHVDEQKLLYKDFRVVPWCPRDQTVLSSHELALGYEDVKDLAVTVKFKVKNPQKFKVPGDLFILAWTTTPWTLPGNVGLAVLNPANPLKNAERYVIWKDQEVFLLASVAFFKKLGKKDSEMVYVCGAEDLLDLEYEPLYPFLKDNISGPEKEKLANAFKIYPADFVTTTDGTGIVHTAVMYGQDDFELGTKVGLPKYHLVNEDGTFKKEAGFLAGRFVKEKDAKGEATLDVDIIKDLAGRGLLFAKEKYQHSYPHCWRCHTPLIYFARDSWYIKMSALRDKLVAENEGINWEPPHIKDGRFGEWLRDVKDWAISRERYWGTPLPVWSCEKCHARKVIGSVAEVSKKPRNTYYVMRHGEAENNAAHIVSDDRKALLHLTEKGIEDVQRAAKSLKENRIDLIIASPVLRTQETAEIMRKTLDLRTEDLITDERIRELGLGAWDGKSLSGFKEVYPLEKRFDQNSQGIESYVDLKKRAGDFLYDIDRRYEGKNILIVTHGSPGMMLISAALGHDRTQSLDYHDSHYLHKATVRPLDFSIIPHNAEYELDLHRPFIDEVRLPCSCGAEMSRAREVMDVWLDSGSMPFAQDHKIGSKEKGEGSKGLFAKLFGSKDKLLYPADYISEGIDQTRGWFYTLHAIGTLMGKGKAYKNVVIGGTLLDAEGKKMSKSLGNTVDPVRMMDIYGADALRFWMYSVNQPGDPKNFDEKTVDEAIKKVFNLALNVLSFYEMYEDKSQIRNSDFQMSGNVLDKWIIARLNQLVATVTEGLESYKFFEPTRAIRDFAADLSQWYIRRSRDRFKGDDMDDKQAALATTRSVLMELSKVLAPFTPFLAEEIYTRVNGPLESVHLEEWPCSAKASQGKPEGDLLKDMETVRTISSKGLEARMSAKINVRQPLQKLAVKINKDSDKGGSKLSNDLIVLIQDEVNVKGVVFNDSLATDVELDVTITSELKEEGDLRELLRKIQDLRKEKGLSVGDAATLVVTDDLKPLVAKYEMQIKKATSLNGIEFGDALRLK